MALFRILSSDGGGIRGLLSTVLIERLIEEFSVPNFISSVNVFAGTSTGGLIALGLAADIPLDEIKDLYLEAGPKIFSEHRFEQILDFGNLLGSQYSNKELGRWLHEIFGNKTLVGLKRKVIVPAFELDNVRDLQPGEQRRWKAKIFHNLPNREADNDRLLREVALYTCSARTLFPVADGFIDGALVANNPSLCALAQALDRRWWSHPHLRSGFPDGFGQPNFGDAGVCTQPSRPDVGGRLDQRELAIGRLDAAIEADAQGMSLAGRGFTMPRTQRFGRTIGADK